jgi:hypothetical protein
MNRQFKKTPNQTVTESDLDKLRAYVISSQRPLQAVRLLEKEKDEREADYNFNMAVCSLCLISQICFAPHIFV